MAVAHAVCRSGIFAASSQIHLWNFLPLNASKFSPEKNLLELMPQVKLDATYPMPEKVELIDYDKEKELTFQEEEDIRELLGQESEGEESDNWWIYAIILLLIGVGALLFYYV